MTQNTQKKGLNGNIYIYFFVASAKSFLTLFPYFDLNCIFFLILLRLIHPLQRTLGRDTGGELSVPEN